MRYFRLFFKKFNKKCVNFFARLDEKHDFLEILRKFSNVFKNFIEKLAKMHRFCIFFDIFSKACVEFFACLCEKRKFLRNFENILKFFDENSIEKLNFYFIFILFFENLLLKIKLSEIRPFFYNNFFGLGGGGFPSFPPGYALEFWLKIN